VEVGGAGALGELSEVETRGEGGTGFEEGAGFSEARERGTVGLNGAWVDETGEEGGGFKAEELGVTGVCWPAKETEVVTCWNGLMEGAFSSGLSDCLIGGA